MTDRGHGQEGRSALLTLAYLHMWHPMELDMRCVSRGSNRRFEACEHYKQGLVLRNVILFDWSIQLLEPRSEISR